MGRDNKFTLTNLTRSKLPSLPFVSMKNFVLGKNYELSLVFVSRAKIQELNKKYRSKNKPTDILSFPLSKTQGEIFINLDITRSEAKKFERGFNNFLAFIFIHGLVHLEGFDHGSRMDDEEEKIRNKFGI